MAGAVATPLPGSGDICDQAVAVTLPCPVTLSPFPYLPTVNTYNVASHFRTILLCSVLGVKLICIYVIGSE